MLLLDAYDPRKVVYRSLDSIVAPDVPAELVGVVPGVVFPTWGDVRPDGRLDVHYGLADSRIGLKGNWANVSRRASCRSGLP